MIQMWSETRKTTCPQIKTTSISEKILSEEKTFRETVDCKLFA